MIANYTFKSDNWFYQVKKVVRLDEYINSIIDCDFWEGHKGVFARIRFEGQIYAPGSFGTQIVGNTLENWTEIECLRAFSLADLNNSSGFALLVCPVLGVGIVAVTMSAGDSARSGRHLFKDEKFAEMAAGIGFLGGPMLGRWRFVGAAGPQGMP
jgi:hypothetical protein